MDSKVPPVPVPKHDEQKDRKAAHRAISLSAVGLAITGGVELLLALYTGSVALLGDSLHNLADVSTSLVVFVGFRVSKRPASRTHPYGYEAQARPNVESASRIDGLGRPGHPL